MQTIITALRHAKRDRNPTDTYPVEYAKPLNAEGREQTKLCRELLGYQKYDLVITSDAERAYETALRVSGSGKILRVPQLGYEYRSARGKLLEKLFKTTEHDTTLEEYYRMPEGAALKQQGREAWRVVRSYLFITKARNVLLVGHGGTLPAMVEAAVANEADRLICRTQIAPQCGGYILGVEHGGIVRSFDLIKGPQPAVAAV